jgi:hypothetical protein
MQKGERQRQRETKRKLCLYRGSIDQVVECLPSKCKTLGLIPSIEKICIYYQSGSKAAHC